jgi:tRNA dimethylallyltransferase
MLGGGWIAETARLLEAGFEADWPSYRTLGYPEMVEHVGGRLSREETIAAIRAATRRFAKRQDTWFRAQPDVEWCDGGEGSDRWVERLSHALEGARPLSVPGPPLDP